MHGALIHRNNVVAASCEVDLSIDEKRSEVGVCVRPVRVDVVAGGEKAGLVVATDRQVSTDRYGSLGFVRRKTGISLDDHQEPFGQCSEWVGWHCRERPGRQG